MEHSICGASPRAVTAGPRGSTDGITPARIALRRGQRALWKRYRSTRDPRARRQLLESHMGLVHEVAHRLHRGGTRALSLPELVSAGCVGLIQSVERFEPTSGTAFSSFAMPRIRGAILDELRKLDPMTRKLRSFRGNANRARHRLEARLGRAPSDQEMAAELGVDLETLWQWTRNLESCQLVSLDDRGTAERTLAQSVPDPSAKNPADALLATERLWALRKAMNGLDERDRLILTLYYYERLRLREIGDQLKLTESRISQLRSRALRRLRETMEEILETAEAPVVRLAA